MKTDFIGDPIPIGYNPWRCGVCDAVCNYEAMTQCIQRSDPNIECGFDKDKPESNFGHYGFIKKEEK